MKLHQLKSLGGKTPVERGGPPERVQPGRTAEGLKTLASPQARRGFTSASSFERPRTGPRLELQAPTSLMSERLDGARNCLQLAAEQSRPDDTVLFLRDSLNADGNNAGHVVLRRGEQILDPSSGRSYESLARFREQNPGYTDVLGTSSGRQLKELLAVDEPSAREAAIARAGLSAIASESFADVQIGDVYPEMAGQPFTLRVPHGRLPAGTQVQALDWPRPALDQPATSEATVRALVNGRYENLKIPKVALDPAPVSVPGVRRYTAGVSTQQQAVEKKQVGVAEQQAKLDKWLSREKEFEKNPGVWKDARDGLETELKRQQTELAKSQRELSDRLVRETMYNRFDASIARCVDFHNKQFSPKPPLDPNIVKSMLFQESRMGTSGEHLMAGPLDWSKGRENPIRSRFNVMQAIDSYESQQLLMIKEMAPELYARHGLQALEGLSKAQILDSDGKGRLGPNGMRLTDAIKEFFETPDKTTGRNRMGGPPEKKLQEDYDFWIRTGVRWLFKKHESLRPAERNWSEAVRSYNGSGAEARKYRQEVMSRVGGLEPLDLTGK